MFATGHEVSMQKCEEGPSHIEYNKNSDAGKNDQGFVTKGYCIKYHNKFIELRTIRPIRHVMKIKIFCDL